MSMRTAWALFCGPQQMVAEPGPMRDLFLPAREEIIKQWGHEPTLEELVAMGVVGFTVRAIQDNLSLGDVIPIGALFALAPLLGWTEDQDPVREFRWESTVALHDTVYDTFDEAGRDFFNRILAMIDRGCSEQIISTGCWVGPMHAPGITTTPFPVMFWDFKNIVAEEGWIDGRGNWLGKPVQPVPVPG